MQSVISSNEIKDGEIYAHFCPKLPELPRFGLHTCQVPGLSGGGGKSLSFLSRRRGGGLDFVNSKFDIYIYIYIYIYIFQRYTSYNFTYYIF